MAKGLVNESSLNNIAEAINVLNGTEGTYLPSEMGEAIIDAIPTETASGNPINITDAAAYPAESVVTTLEPVQDLHGYDKPWPAGGGKNFIKMTVDGIKALNSSGTWSGNEFTTNGITFTLQTDDGGNVTGIKVTGTASATIWNFALGSKSNLPASNAYALSGCPSGGSDSSYFLQTTASLYDTGFNYNDTGSGVSIPSLASAQEAYVRIVIVNGYACPSGGLLFKPLLRVSTASSDFEPYSNECPISGHTGVELINSPVEPNAEKIVTYEPIQEGSGDPSPENVRPILPAFSFERDNGEVMDVYGCEIDWVNGVLRVDRVKETKRWGDSQYSTTIGTVERKEISLSSSAVYPPTTGKPQLCSIAPYKANYFEDSVHFYINANSTNQLVLFLPVGTSDDTAIEVSYQLTTPIEIQLTPTEMERVKEALKTETHAITFPQAQSPVYGCEVDWANGILKVTEAYIDLGTKTYARSQNAPRFYFQSTASDNMKPAPSTTVAGNIICSQYATHSQNELFESTTGISVDSSTLPWINIYDPQFANATVAEFKTAMSGVQLVYELATTLETPLTPEVITLLKGENNVWTDAGTSEIEYKVDLNSYIQKLIEEASAH